MNISGVLVRFTAVYLLLVIIIGTALNFFGVGSNGGVNLGILFGTIFWVCSSFAKSRGRYFNKNEKTKVVTGFALINIVIQAIFATAALAGTNQEVSFNILIASVAFIGALHSAAIYFFVGFAKRPLVKQGVIASE